MTRSNLPKFGNWESEENIPYTTYFENPRRGLSSEKVNPNSSPGHANIISKKEAKSGSQTPRAKHEYRVSKEEGEVRRTMDSPSRHDGGRRASGDSTPQRATGVSNDVLKRVARANGGGTRSADQSPLHPRYQAKIGAKGSSVSSPSWERKSSHEGSHGVGPSTPGRSRLRSVPRGSETPDRGASIPKFGEWDETDPSSADGFSHIFNRVKEERHGVGSAPGTTTDAKRSNTQKHYKGNGSKGCCCFPWGGN